MVRSLAFAAARTPTRALSAIVTEIDGAALEFHLARDHPRVIEQVGDQPPLRRHAAPNGRERLG